MSKHTVPPSSKTDRGEIDYFVRSVDRKRKRVIIEIPEYNARLIFTYVFAEGVVIFQEKDRQKIDPDGIEPTLHVSHDVYAHIVKVAASILSQRSQAEV